MMLSTTYLNVLIVDGSAVMHWWPAKPGDGMAGEMFDGSDLSVGGLQDVLLPHRQVGILDVDVPDAVAGIPRDGGFPRANTGEVPG